MALLNTLLKFIQAPFSSLGGGGGGGGMAAFQNSSIDL